MLRSYQANISWLYLIKLAKWLMLIMPIVALFYRENGLSDFDIYLLQAVYSVSVAILEIPSGYLADMVGRRKTLILGAILGTLGFAIYGCSSSFPAFLAAELILGFGGSFISGADSALLYDSLAARDRHHQFLQYEGRITSLGNFAETIAAVCGGLLAAWLGYRSVYLGQTLIAFLAIPASFMLLEPKREMVIERAGFSDIFTVCRTALLINKRLAATIVLSSIIGVCTLCMAWSAQVYFVYRGFDESLITPVWVALNLTVAIGSAYAARLKAFWGEYTGLWLIMVLIPTGYLWLGLLPVYGALGSLLLFYAMRGYATPVLKDMVNKECPQSHRATILSLRSMIIRLGFALLGPALGHLSARMEFTQALAGAGLVLLLITLPSGVLLLHWFPEMRQARK